MKKLLLFAMWLAATATAVGVAWAGVSFVDAQVVAPPSAEFLPATSSGAAADVLGDESALTSRRPVSASISGGAQASSTTESASALASTSTSVGAVGPSTSVSTTRRSTSTNSVPTTATTITAVPTTAATITKTFTLIGGTAAFSYSASGVEVLWATANPGFDVEIQVESPGMKVEFRAEHHRSRVDAWWSNGAQHTIREEPRD